VGVGGGGGGGWGGGGGGGGGAKVNVSFHEYYRVAKMQRMPEVAGLFPQKSH